MPEASFTLSAFGDEIADDLDEQLRVLRELRIGALELRGVWGKNVLALEDAEVEKVRHACVANGVRVSCIGSPVGKSPLAEPLAQVEASLSRAAEIARRLETNRVRVFSFYPPDGSDPDTHVAEAASRLGRLAAAAPEGITLLLENERGLVGDTSERCAALLRSVDSARLCFVWDVANFVVAGVEQPVDRGWAALAPYLAHVQVKDARLGGEGMLPAGEGDGQVPELLDRLRESGYRGYLALEPHLAYAGPRGGFSSPYGMARAAAALRRLMAERGCHEAPAAQQG